MGKPHSQDFNEPCSAASSSSDKWIPITVNDELPGDVMELLQATPTSLVQGEVVIFRIPLSGENTVPEKILLHPESSVCNIVRSAANGYYHLRFIDPTGVSARTHSDIDLCIRQGRLISISSRGTPVAVVLPLTHSGGLLLVPKLAIPLPGIHAPNLPPAEADYFRVTPNDLRVLPPSSGHMSVQLQLIDDDRFSRLRQKQKNTVHRFSFRLPNLTQAGNVIPPPEVSAANPLTIQWDGVKESAAQENFTGFTCSLSPVADADIILKESFNKIANSGCAGEVSNADPMFSLAMVYTTLQIMNKKGVTEDEWNGAASRYCTLFNNKSFCELMQRVATNSGDVILTHEAASSRSAAGKTERRRVIELLRDADNRNKLTADILHYISLRLCSTYQELRDRLAGDTELRLVLRRLSYEDGRLSWHFILQPADTSPDKSPEP